VITPLTDPGFISDVWWPSKEGGRGEFNLTQIYQEFMQLAVRAKWEAMARCPCGSADQNAQKLQCPVCGGSGWEVHHDQIVRLMAVGVRSNLSLWERFGEFRFGEASFTSRGEHAPAMFDRLTLLDARIAYNDLVKRRGTVDTLRYPVTAKLYTNSSGVIKTLDVTHLRSSGVGGSPGSILVKGTDFVINASGNIDWTLGIARQTAPAVGSLYSICYYTMPVYRVTTFPHDFRDTRTKRTNGAKTSADHADSLPVQFNAKLEWIE
jgi:hypothetical protein